MIMEDGIAESGQPWIGLVRYRIKISLHVHLNISVILHIIWGVCTNSMMASML